MLRHSLPSVYGSVMKVFTRKRIGYIAAAILGASLCYISMAGFAFDLFSVDYHEGFSDLRWSEDGDYLEFHQNEAAIQSERGNYHQSGKVTVFRFHIEDDYLEPFNVIDLEAAFDRLDWFTTHHHRTETASPNGTLIADIQSKKLYVTNVETGFREQVSGDFSSFEWSPDGSQIALISQNERMISIYDLSSETNRKIRKMPLTLSRILFTLSSGWLFWALIPPLCFAPVVKVIRFGSVRKLIWVVFGLYYLLYVGSLCISLSIST